MAYLFLLRFLRFGAKVIMKTTGTQTHRFMPKPFDIHSEEDDRELKNWCRLNWQQVICKGIQGKNAPTYHDCCVCFTKRGCLKKSSHPAIQSVSVLKIPTLKHSTDHEGLYRWLKARLRTNHRLEMKTYFPTINSAHFSFEEDYEEDPEEQVELLGKRLNKTMDELTQAKQDIDKLRLDNKVLVSSSQNWCKKYQELLHRDEEETPSYAETTPFKPKNDFISAGFINF